MYAAFGQCSADENFRIVPGIGPGYDPVAALGQVEPCAFEALQVVFFNGFRQNVSSAFPIENVERHAIDHLSEHRRIIRIASVAERKTNVHLRRTAAHILPDAAARHGSGAQKRAKYFQ